MGSTLLRLLKLAIFFVSILCTIYVGTCCYFDGYKLLWLMPLSYCFCSFFLFKYLNNRSTVFYLVLNILIFLRFVALPFYIVYAPLYKGASLAQPLNNYLLDATILIAYELVVCTIPLCYFERKNQITRIELRELLFNEENIQRELCGNKIYIIFIGVITLLLLLDTKWLTYISFFTPSFMDIEYSTDVFLSSYLFILVKELSFVFIVTYLATIYLKTDNVYLLYLILLFILLNISIYKGGNRADILVVGIVSLIYISNLLPRLAIKKIWLISTFFLFVTFSAVTSARSYQSFTDGHNKKIDRAGTFQAYLGSPYNVAIALETGVLYPESRKAEVLLYDVLRPMFGINQLVKSWNLQYSNQYFNKRFYLSDDRTQILPTIGQGYLFFGPFLAPLLSVFIISFAYFIHRISFQIKSVVLYYFFTLSFVRFSFFMGQNLMIMINDFSFNIFLIGIIYIINKQVKGI